MIKNVLVKDRWWPRVNLMIREKTVTYVNDHGYEIPNNHIAGSTMHSIGSSGVPRELIT